MEIVFHCKRSVGCINRRRKFFSASEYAKHLVGYHRDRVSCAVMEATELARELEASAIDPDPDTGDAAWLGTSPLVDSRRR